MLPHSDPVGASLREFPVKITSVLISILKNGPRINRQPNKLAVHLKVLVKCHNSFCGRSLHF